MHEFEFRIFWKTFEIPLKEADISQYSLLYLSLYLILNFSLNY